MAETTLKNQSLDKDLVIHSPKSNAGEDLVEKDSEGGYYFVINDFPGSTQVKPRPRRKTPGHVS